MYNGIYGKSVQRLTEIMSLLLRTIADVSGSRQGYTSWLYGHILIFNKEMKSMGDWERTFGEAGMSGGFNDSFRQKPNDWVQRTRGLGSNGTKNQRKPD